MRKAPIGFVMAAMFLFRAVAARAEEPATTPQTIYVTLEQVGTVDSDGGVVTAIDGFIFRLLTGPLGIYSAYYVDPLYAEAIIGPAFMPTKWLAIGFGTGIGQTFYHAPGRSNWRVGGAIWLGSGRVTSLTFVESGGIGPWARTEFNIRMNDWLGLGLLGDVALGIGPRLEFNLPGTPLQLWWAPVVADTEGGVTQFGVRLNM